MNQIKKIVSIILLATALVLSLTVSAFATDITIEGGNSNSEYAAYKILDATHGGENKFAYTLNSKYEDIIKSVTGKTERADIIAYIESLTDSDIQDFADAVYEAIVAANTEADYTADDNKFEDVEQGYYLIAETKVGDTADTFSLVMLNTAGIDNITVNTKEDLPTVSKQVEEINDTTGESSWGESADYDIGDAINYMITGTVSEKYELYNSYYYNFSDTMEKGLTYNKDAKFYVVNGNDKTEITDSFTVNADDNGFTAAANLKEIAGVDIDGDSTIVVEYTATLNENAVAGTTGNKNEVYLEYENNPYAKADGDITTVDKPTTPGKTPLYVNVVFTFDAVVNKVDGEGNALSGAGFTLYKWVAENNDYVAVNNEITGVTSFDFRGLDVGKYKLVESTVPQGYNKCNDIVFEVVAEYDLTTDPDTLTALSVKNENGDVISEGTDAVFTTVLSDGKISTDVENLTGPELPETGGMGTTIFYIVGGILVVGAVVLLVAKKRMSND